MYEGAVKPDPETEIKCMEARLSLLREYLLLQNFDVAYIEANSICDQAEAIRKTVMAAAR